MVGVEVLVRLWKDWGIQVLVLLSFAVQVILLILAEVRRRKDSGLVKAAVWSAYLTADTTAIYALGHLSVTSRSPDHQLMAFWAPFLLLHLGGQDNITAYAIEDNRLWMRHLQALAVQVVAAGYVLYESSIVGSQTFLWRAAILMLVVGVLKYGERVWTLNCASTNNEPNKNYRAHRQVSLSVGASGAEWGNTEQLLRTAHLFLCTPKNFFERLGNTGTPIYSWDPPREFCEKSFVLAEMQLSLMHDVLYSKAEVMPTWYGICIRIFSSASTAAALLLFHFSGQADHRHGYSRVDVALTYALLVGAVILETTSLLRAMFSSWIVAPLVDMEPSFQPRWWRRQYNLLVWRVRRLVLPERRRWWSDSMGQHNLFELLDGIKTSPGSRFAKKIGVEDWWNTMVHSRHIPVPPKMKHLLVKLWFKISDVPLQRQNEVICKAMGTVGVKMAFGDSILVWHIATNVYLRWYKDHQKQSKDQSPSQDEEQPEVQSEDQRELVEAIEALSNYMLFLLAARPYMLPDNASRSYYSGLCYDLNETRDASTEDFVRSLQAYGMAMNRGIPPYGDTYAQLLQLPLPATGNRMLQRGSQLGAKLIGEESIVTPADKMKNVAPVWREFPAPEELKGDELGILAADRLEMIALVWAMMLFEAGSRCGAYPHSKQLSNGGEFLTVAALVKAHIKSIRKWSDYNTED